MLTSSLPGNRNTNGNYNNQGSNGNRWSSTEDGSNAYNRKLNDSNSDVNRNSNNKDNGFSVVCLQVLYQIYINQIWSFFRPDF